MDKIKLLPHNQEMVYEIEKAMVDGHRKIFYTEATGLGKSYIFMYLMHKYFRDKKVLYICPKYHIWHNMQEYEDFKYIKDNVVMMCYADFNKIKDRHMGFDAIFIDEAHHLATPIQGENIIKVAEEMLTTNPKSFMFGFTATPYVDNKFIGDVYFDASVNGMDLFDAINKGVLQKIHYAVAVKDNIVLPYEEKSLAIKYNVDTTRMMVRDIVDQYTNVKHWLAYFPFIEELNANLEYFEQYFPDYKIFTIHSEIENTEKILSEFEEYSGKAILASVSMVLEGIHPKSVGGILLYRNVHRTNTFFQIIGRLGIMKPDVTPICIDIYGSYNNIMSNNIIREIDFIRNTNGKKSIKDYIYMTSNTCEFLELLEIIYNLRSDNIHEYRGITWSNDAELSKKLGRYAAYVNQSIRKGKTREELIDRYLDTQPNVYRGISWTHNRDLSRKLGLHDEYVSTALRMGRSYKEIIDYCLDNKPLVKTYRGISWTLDTDLSRKLGMSSTYVSYNIRNGKTYEEIIDHCLDNKPVVKTYRGISWTLDAELSRKLGMSKLYVSSNIRNGKTYEEIIDHCLDNKPNEYRGITWTSNSELARKIGKSESTITYNIQRGKTCEELIDDYLDNKPTIKTYRGFTWSNDVELSRKLGGGKTYVCSAIRRGKTREELIDAYLDNKVNEYRGISWTSDSELSRKLGKSNQYVYQMTIHNGKTREELIDAYLDDNPMIQTYRGLTWSNDVELSRKLGWGKSYVNQSIRRGKTCEELIDAYLDNKPNEYRGISWTSDSELSRKLGCSKSYVCGAIRRGKTREELIDAYLDNKNNSD